MHQFRPHISTMPSRTSGKVVAHMKFVLNDSKERDPGLCLIVRRLMPADAPIAEFDRLKVALMPKIEKLLEDYARETGVFTELGTVHTVT